MEALLKKYPILFYLLIFFSAALLYFCTAQRGYSWQDSGEFQYRVLIGDYHWCSGIARAHPLYIWLARIWSFLFPSNLKAWGINAFSGLGMATALTFLAAILRSHGKSYLATTIAVITLGFAHMAWWMSTVAEVYTWSLALLFVALFCLTRFFQTKKEIWLLALFLANGLHLGIHNFALLELPFYLIALLVYGWKEKRFKGLPLILSCGIAYALGAFGIIVLAVQSLAGGDSLAATLKSILFGIGYEDAVLGLKKNNIHMILANYGLAAFSFLTPCWVLACRGIYSIPPEKGDKKIYLILLFFMTLLHVIFGGRYFVSDQATFILPTLGLLALWAGLGAEKEGTSHDRKFLFYACLAGLVSSCLFPAIAARAISLGRFSKIAERRRSLPGRNEISYWLIPWKMNERSAEQFIEKVRKTMRPGEVLIADNTAAAPLLAARAGGSLPQTWTLVCQPLHNNTMGQASKLIEKAPRAFIVSPAPGYESVAGILDGRFRFQRRGIVYQIYPNTKHSRQK